MAKQTILWTALPNGYSDDGKSLRISLLVSPRLEPNPGEPLKSFPDFLDWPATLAQTRIVLNYGASDPVKIAGNDPNSPMRIDDRFGLPDSKVWKALFPGKTIVHGFEFRDLTSHEVLSFPAEEMDTLVRGLYSRLAASALDQLPTASTFLRDPEWRQLLDAVNESDRGFHDKRGIRQTAAQFDAFKEGQFAAESQRSNLARFQLFHTPPSTQKVDRYNVLPDDPKARAEWVGYEQTELPKPADFQDEIDFHKIVAAMNQYPTLLRRLGLVVDVLVSKDAFAPAADALLWAEVTLPPGTPEVERVPDASPRTHARLDGARFQTVAIPVPPGQPGFGVVNGLLDLDPQTFGLLQADVDGAGFKLMNFARSLIILDEAAPDQQLDPVTRKKRDMGAPALRNAGLMLVHKGRGELLKQTISRQSGFNDLSAARVSEIQKGNPAPPPPPEMFAQDVVRGYRIDIWDDVSKRWHSLCRRKATYDIDKGAKVIHVPEEEGTVRLAATTSPDEASNPDIIWLHEALVSWAGWSLCAPAPGKTIHHQATKIDNGHEVIVHEDPVGEPEAEVPPGVRLQSTFQALPGTLPRLRYGRSYWLRARVVDLAGNSLELVPKDFGPERSKDNARPYFRYEPISAPAIALVKPTPTTTARPAEGESMERMAVRSFNKTPALNTVPTTQRARRFVVPSRTTQREAEQHGMCDRAGIVDPAFFAMLAAKDHSLAEEKVLTAGPPPGGAPVETGYAVMLDGDALPYLPDPLAVQIAARIFDHPNFPAEKIITIPFYDGTKWPDALPFKIEIYEDPADEPHYDAQVRTLFIPLPKAARVTLRLSVRPGTDALKILGVWNWLTLAQQTQKIIVDGTELTLDKLVNRGQHWMLTPWRNLELVHAVQRPLITPEVMEINVIRDDGATCALPNFVATCSIPSTDRIDLRADWNEPFEDAVDNKLENRARIDHAFSIKITDEKSWAGSPEYFPEGKGTDLIRAGGRFHDRIKTKLHEFHDTRYRRIEYWLEATTKFREFLPPGLLTKIVDGELQPTEENIKVVGSKVRTWIRSSAPPPAPDVLYVVPTFGWVRSGDEANKKSWRRGGGLRVYLNRPWNASGYGEMLAVVLPGATFTDDPNDEPEGQPLKNFVTQWGNDPIWLSPFVPGNAPKSANFPLARTAPDPDGKWLPTFAPAAEADQPPGPFMTAGLRHPDLNDPVPPECLVDIAPHDVFYDEERRLWYCDIEVTWGAAYFPFIRLALARYQPVALDKAHLSNVVLADFMPLVPDRWLNVTQTSDPRTRRVSVFGNTYADSSSHQEAPPVVAQSSVVEVWVERLDPAFGEDFGWRRESDAIIQRDAPFQSLQASAPVKATVAKARTRATGLLRQREFEALVDEDLVRHIFVTPALWEGTVTLPATGDSAARYRFAIAEYEEYLVDDAKPYDEIPTKKERRLVFVEYVEQGV